MKAQTLKTLRMIRRALRKGELGANKAGEACYFYDGKNCAIGVALPKHVMEWVLKHDMNFDTDWKLLVEEAAKVDIDLQELLGLTGQQGSIIQLFHDQVFDVSFDNPPDTEFFDNALSDLINNRGGTLQAPYSYGYQNSVGF